MAQPVSKETGAVLDPHGTFLAPTALRSLKGSKSDAPKRGESKIRFELAAGNRRRE
jgi:hypothetical protein